jgi:hypothetical protein
MGALPVVAPVVGLVMVLLRLIQVPDEAEPVPIATESRSLG